jgi:serine protease Do
MIALAVFALGTAALISVPSAARADSRESVRKALPATVAVEEQAAQREELKSPRPPDKDPKDPTAETEREKQAQEYRGRMRFVRRLDRLSGAAISADGLVVTLIGGGDKAENTVTFEDGRALPARLLVEDHRSGLRLLKVDARDLPFLALAEQEPQIGDELVCTYCTSSNERAAARGMLAARKRSTAAFPGDLLQLDIVPGRMSGGAPVVDSSGRLVGLIVRGDRGPMVAVPGGIAGGMTSVVPAKAIRALLEARQGDEPVIVRRGFLGIQLMHVIDDGNARVLAHPVPDSPAAAAGFHDGDEIVAVDGSPVASPEEITARIGQHAPGQKVTIGIRREGKEQSIEVTLGRQPQPTGAAGAGAGGIGPSPAVVPAGLAPGAAPPIAAEAVTPEAIYILGVDGKLYPLAGGAAGKPIENLRELRRLYDRLPAAARRPLPPLEQPGATAAAGQRPEVDRRLQEVSRNVQSLREQLEKLTEELQRLQKELAAEPKK